MANFKRHKPKTTNQITCWFCPHHSWAPTTNGVGRYPAKYWKQFGGKNTARYIHKNVKEYESVVDLPS